MPAGNSSFDAIVVGTGISGGWAAKELTEKGLKTLVLDRGRMVEHGDYPTANLQLWELPYAGRPTQEDLETAVGRRTRRRRVSQATKHWFVNDIDHPYIEKKPFDWVRGYHVGGRSIMWGRQKYRWSPMDFEANAKDGVGVDWPIRYEEIAPWYDHVESFIGVSGQAEGYEQLPDGKFLPPMALNCVEQHLKQALADKLGRAAHHRQRLRISPRRSRTARSAAPASTAICAVRGCPFGAYFSSNSSTLPAAEKTGNMTLRPNSIVYELIYDAKQRQGQRRARARCGNQRAAGIPRQGGVPVRVHVRFHAHPDEFRFQQVSQRLRQRQRRARLQHHGSSPRRRRVGASSKASRTSTTAASGPTASTFRASSISARTSATTCAVSVTRAARRGQDGPGCSRTTR